MKLNFTTRVSLAEDALLRDAKWDVKYPDERVVFWDNTNIDLDQASNAELQSLTYSQYYAGNVAKGAVSIQRCGWASCHDLYPGGISDTRYMNECGILEEQKRFQDADDGVKFMNILDRGYRCTKASWQNGQFVLQPTFAKSDEKFSCNDVVRSASIAADRSGNERAVRIAKLSSYLKYGNHTNTVRLSDAWEAWIFQMNFMYQSVM